VRVRLRGESGFGLIELLMAMVMLNVGILAIVASYNAGIISLKRASKLSTAATLADAQMEQYRALTWAAIALDPSTIPATAPYTTDAAYSTTEVTGTCSGALAQHNECNASRVVTGPDRKPYRIDTYIGWYCAAGALRTATYNGTTYSTASPGCTDSSTPPVDQARAVKQVTVVVRDATTTSRTYMREASVFDQAT